MANTDSPRGLIVAGPLLSAKMYKIADTYATSLYVGDPVVRNSSGDIVIATTGTGNAILGAAIGFYDSSLAPLATNYYVGSTAGVHYCLVADSPSQLFMVQEDSVGGTNYALVDLAANSTLVAGAGGSTVSGQSSWEADSSDTPANTAADQIRLVDLYQSPGNAVGTNAKWLVRINNHQGAPGIVGVGI